MPTAQQAKQGQRRTYAQRAALAKVIRTNTALRHIPRNATPAQVAHAAATRNKRARRGKRKTKEREQEQEQASLAAASRATNIAWWDTDDSMNAKLRASLQAEAQAVAAAKQDVAHLEAKVAQLEADLATRPWLPWQGFARAQLQGRIRDARIQLRQLQRKEQALVMRKTRWEALKRVWRVAGHGSGRRRATSEHEAHRWSTMLHRKEKEEAGGQAAGKKGGKAAGAKAQHGGDVDMEDMLAYALVHNLEQHDYGTMLTNLRVCPWCQAPMAVATDNQLRCTACHLQVDASAVVTMGMVAQTAKQSNAPKSANDYKPALHFMERLAGVQGQRMRTIKPEIFRELCAYAHKYRIPRHDHNNVWVGREMLYAIGQSRLYEWVQLILTQFSGIRPPQIPPVLQQEFSILIRHIHPVWREIQRVLDESKLRHRPANCNTDVQWHKRNSPNAGFCFNHITKLLGHPELMTSNWSIWEKQNLKHRNEMMRVVFFNYGWEFEPLEKDRMGGPAMQAVRKRKMAFNQLQTVLDAHDWRPATQFELLEQQMAKESKNPGRLQEVRTVDGGGVETRGRNRDAREAMGEDAWEAVRSVAFECLYYTKKLSNVNPKVAYPARVARAQRLIRQYDVVQVQRILQDVKVPVKEDEERAKRAAQIWL